MTIDKLTNLERAQKQQLDALQSIEPLDFGPKSFYPIL